MAIDPLGSAAALHDLIIAHRDETEAQRQLPQRIVEALVETGLGRMALATEDGGLETSPLDALAVYERLAAADASVAWVAWNNSLVCWFARFLSPDVRGEIFGDPSRLHANSTRPTGRAARDGDGYRVTGQWSLVSGCMHAQWIPVMALVEADGEVELVMPGVPNMRLFFVPRASYEILDTWYAGGLRGTGSHDAVLEDEAVRPEHSISLMEPSLIDSPFGRVPIIATMSAGCAAICLGLAQAAADALIELGRTKVSPDPGPDLRDRAANQSAVARTMATIGAMRRQLYGAYAELWRKVQAGDSPTPEDLAAVWATRSRTSAEFRLSAASSA